MPARTEDGSPVGAVRSTTEHGSDATGATGDERVGRLREPSCPGDATRGIDAMIEGMHRPFLSANIGGHASDHA